MSKLQYRQQTVGRILVYLVEQGLDRVDFEEADAMEIMTERRGDEEEVIKAFADCLAWMKDEGLIRIEKQQEYSGGFYFSGVQLTAKGLAVIKAEPKDADMGGSIEKQIEKADGAPMDGGMYSKIGEFVGSLLAGFTKSISS